ncbi:MAG: hypothetical protein JJE21_03610 [Spirochaetaceae bacterium]|nr:hypothetical protein [Spirochaetaceae bacterium]
MFTNKNIIDFVIDDRKYNAIVFDNKDTNLPHALLAGEKAVSYLYKDGILIEWYWKGFSQYEGSKCVYFDKINIHPLAELSTSLRHKAPMLINQLAKAICLCDSKFLDLRGGIISAWRIYFTDDDDILLLSSNLSDIFASTNSEDTRYENTSSFIHSGIHEAFTLIDLMAQYYYLAAIGLKPFGDPSIREIGYKAIPLSLAAPIICPELNKELIDKIDGILGLSLGKQRNISGNLNSQKALEWFFSKFDNTEWDLKNLDKVINTQKLLEENEKTKGYLNLVSKKANQKIFLRNKGTMIIIVAIIVITVGTFTYSRIKEYLAPPYTAEMDQNGVIESYYKAQNDLNVEELDASFAHGVNSPIETEVTTLFVSRQTRQAYESKDTIINPVTWESESRPIVDANCIIYGVDDVNIESIGNNNYKVSSIFYSPDNYQENTVSSVTVDPNVDMNYFYTYRFKQVQIFTIEMNKKGWYEISGLKTQSTDYMDTLKIPTKIVQKTTPYTTQPKSTKEIVDNRVTTQFVDENIVKGESNI